MPDAAQDILAPLQIPDSVKADAWDAYHAAGSHVDLTPKLMAVKGLPDSAKADLWDAKFAEVKQNIATSGQQFIKQNSMPEAYGFTPRNILKNVAQFGEGIVGLAKDVANPKVPIVQGQQGLLGPDTLLGKYGYQPAAAQRKLGQQEVAQGNKIPGYVNQALSEVPFVGPMIGAIGEQAGRGDIGGAATQTALNIGAQKAASAIGGPAESTEPSTMGMRQGGAVAAVEKLANRIPVASSPLKSRYMQVADSFRATVQDAVQKTAGIKVDATDPVGALNAGSDALKAQSRALYKPVDDYIKTNNIDMVNRVVQALSADPEVLSKLPAQVYDHPINGIKQAIDMLQQKGASAMNARPLDAHSYFQRATEMQGVLDQITQSLPPDLKQSYDSAQVLYGKHAAMKDIADTFDKAVEGLPPSKQPTGIAKGQQPIKATSLLENLKSEPRLRQAFGPDLANALVEHTARLASAQGFQGGSGLIGGLYGTSLLARAFTGYGATTIPIELGGLYALSKVLATPAAHPFYANMLRATSLAEQDYWARQAVATAMKNQGKK